MNKTYGALMVLGVLANVLSSCQNAAEKVGQLPDTSQQDVEALRPSVMVDTLAYTATIDQYKDSVNRKMDSLKLVRKEVLGTSAEGGEVSFYLRNSDTLKAHAVFYGETGKRECFFYLKNHQLVRFEEKATHYQFPIGKKTVKVNSVTTRTLILKNGNVVYGKEGNETIKKGHQQQAQEINELYQSIR